MIGLRMDRLGRKLTKFTALRQKVYNYWIHDEGDNKKAKGTKQECLIKQELTFDGYENYLEANQAK